MAGFNYDVFISLLGGMANIIGSKEDDEGSLFIVVRDFAKIDIKSLMRIREISLTKDTNHEAIQIYSLDSKKTILVFGLEAVEALRPENESINDNSRTSQAVYSQPKQTDTSIAVKTFYFHGQRITISEEYDAYNALRQDFYKKALSIAGAYMKLYDGYGDMEKFVRRGYEDGHKLIDKEILSDLQQSLVKRGIYDENIPQLYADYCRNNPYWDNAFDEIAEKYLAISRRQEEVDAYRTARRQNRGRFYGAGFGLSGALKASMQAGAMNMATGALHGIFNLGAKAIDLAKAGYKAAELYHSEETRDTLFQGIGLHVLHMHRILWAVMAKRVPQLARIPILTPNASQRAEAIRGNMRSMSRDSAIKVFPEVLLLNPYSEDLYRIMFHIVGENDTELTRIAKYFNVDI